MKPVYLRLFLSNSLLIACSGSHSDASKDDTSRKTPAGESSGGLTAVGGTSTTVRVAGGAGSTMTTRASLTGGSSSTVGTSASNRTTPGGGIPGTTETQPISFGGNALLPLGGSSQRTIGGAAVQSTGGARAAGSSTASSGGNLPTGGRGTVTTNSGGATTCSTASAAGTATTISLDGKDIASTNSNGLTFKGFGVLSANGTSELLMDYKSEQPEKYLELLKLLFSGERPIMTQLKVEMGNDRNNSTGPAPATMRLASEAANVRRAQDFQLAADAKKVNPNLKVSILRWNAPGWVKNNDQVYTWYKSTILAAYRAYGFMVDYVNPGVNESAPDFAWTTDFASRIRSDSNGFDGATEQQLFNAIKVIISDEAGLGSFGDDMVSSATLRNAVSVAGYHYNTDDDNAGNFKKLADQYDKEVWNSEAQATFSNTAFRPTSGNGIGGTNGPLEMANTIIKGFVNSRRTHFIYQPAIGSFYEGGQYSFKEVISARDPWSGWMHYDAGLEILRHFSWFSKAGFENTSNSLGVWRAVPQASYTGATGTNPVSGANGTPSYMTLASPDKTHFSAIFANDSARTQTYRLSTSSMAFEGKPTLEVWETRAADSGNVFNSNYLKHVCDAPADTSGNYTINVKPYSIVTVTTLKNSANAEYHAPLPVEGTRTVLDTDASGSVRDTTDKILYADDFDYSRKTVPVIGAFGAIAGTEEYVTARGGSLSVMPRYFCDRNGAFEAFLPSGSTNPVLRQQIDQVTMGLGGTWNNGNPITGIGDNRWLNYKASIDVAFENDSTQSGNNYAAIGVRQQGGDKSHYINGTPYALKFTFEGGWQLLVDGTAIASGNVVSGKGGVTIPGFKTAPTDWHNLALEAVDKKVTAYLDGTKLATYTDTSPRMSGRVDLASGYYFTRFDNLRIETVDGSAPYYSEFLDNLETYDLASPPAAKLIYRGSWSHKNGQGMYNYQRSLSSGGNGATLSYTFTGTGLDILGPNDGSAKLEVAVDGQVTSTSTDTWASTEFYQTFALRGLANATHTVSLKVLSGTLVVDAVGVVAAPI